MDFINSVVPELSSTRLHTGSVCCLSGVTKLCQGKGGEKGKFGPTSLISPEMGFYSRAFLELMEHMWNAFDFLSACQ